MNCTSSSLERLESSHVRLERKLSQVGNLVQKMGQDSAGTPTISNQAFGTPFLNKALMKNAEIGQRRWSSIGVEEWIQAGRWWLLKVEFLLSRHTSATNSVANSRIVPKCVLYERFVGASAFQAGLCRSCQSFLDIDRCHRSTPAVESSWFRC